MKRLQNAHDIRSCIKMAADNGFPNGWVVSVIFNLLVPIPTKKVENTGAPCKTDHLKVVIMHAQYLLHVNKKHKITYIS